MRIILLILIIHCSLYSFSQDSNTLFSKWKSDTLKTINSSISSDITLIKDYRFNKGNIVYKEVRLINSDSAYFEIIDHYKRNIIIDSINIITDDVIKYVIELLVNCHELPKYDFLLEFANQTSYYPSEIYYLKYNFVSEINNIKVSIPNLKKEFDYDYIRGRICAKEEILRIKESIK